MSQRPIAEAGQRTITSGEPHGAVGISGENRIAVLPGDGIGPEVMGEACRVLEAAATVFGFSLEIEEYDLGGRRYARTGEVLPETVFQEIRTHAAILVGPIGIPADADDALKQIEQRFRLEFDLFVGRRPCRLLPGISSPIDGLTSDRCDLVVIRENNEGLFSAAGGLAYAGTDHEVAVQAPLTTRFGVERTVRYAFEVARSRRQTLTVSHKTSPLMYAGGLWERVVKEVGSEFPDVTTEYQKIDKVCVQLLTEPERFDVIVADTLFGDIISDVGAVLQGGKPVAPSGMINPDRRVPSMFEPLHGTAHDIAGTGKADPTGAIRTAAMLLDHLGQRGAAEAVEQAVGAARSRADTGAGTRALGDAIVSALTAPS